METIEIGNQGRYNFHNVQDIRIKVLQPITRNGIVVATELTLSQQKRIKKHFCPFSDCGCGSSPRGWEQIDYDRAVIHFE